MPYPLQRLQDIEAAMHRLEKRVESLDRVQRDAWAKDKHCDRRHSFDAADRANNGPAATMRLANWTPGPWSVADTDQGYQVIGGNCSTVAECRRDGYQFASVRKANAHLIAAAPDMLAALLKIIEHAPAAWNDGLTAAVNNAKAAICKGQSW